MKRIVADVKQDWESLSDDHEKLTNHVGEILDKYVMGEEADLSFLITGVFGIGKTLLMIHIFKECLNKGLLPLYVLAEDIFGTIAEGRPGDLKRKTNNFVSSFVECFKDEDYEEIRTLIRAEKGELKNDLLNILEHNQGKVKHAGKVVLLVDELEDEYKSIKEKIGTDPLRLLLQDKSYLKFLSLTPSGVYGLGGADESRLQKLNIPPVSIEYIRTKIEDISVGKANALWWVSRGIPRHVIKNRERIKNISEMDGDYKIGQTLDALDRIGKEPGRVSAVDLGFITDQSRIKHLIDLLPRTYQTYKGFTINKDLVEGELSNILQNVFGLSDNDEKRKFALMISHYFKLVAMTISDENFNAYLEGNEINEFMGLSLDILLENEYKSSIVEKNMVQLLDIYEKIKDGTILLTTLITNQIDGVSFTDLEKKLPFAIREIRRLFPLPMANPIIKSNPKEVIRDVEGRGKPVCKVDENAIFFASYRDFEQYLGTDEFKDKALPDEKYLMVLLPEERFSEYESVIQNPTSKNEQLLKWLDESKKLRVVKLPPSIKLFLLSLYGYENRVPFDIQDVASQIKTSLDPLLQKKFELYYVALQELIEDSKLTPKYFFKHKIEPKGVGDVWGASQITEDNVDVAVAGLSQAFRSISPIDKSKLISLRELFRTKERRGKLANIKVGHALPTLADDLLPRKDRKGNLVDAPSVESLKEFWGKDTKENLEKLAILLPFQEFKKLNPDPSYKRILEAFWRAIREEFNVEPLDDLKRRLNEILSRIEYVLKVGRNARKNFKFGIILDEKYQNIVKSLEGIKELTKISSNDKLLNYILQLYLDGVLNKIESDGNALYNDVGRIDSRLESLEIRINEVMDSIKDKKEVLDFIKDKTSYTELKQEIESLKKIENDLSLSDTEIELRERVSLMDTIFSKFGELEMKLNALKEKFSANNLLEV